MKTPMFPPFVGVGVPVFCAGTKGNLKIAFCAVAKEGLPSKNGPVIYAGIPLVETYTQFAEYCTL
jgi:hypothetical protein